MTNARPENLTYIRQCFELLENTLLADGRNWVLNTDKPSLADIEGELFFSWLKFITVCWITFPTSDMDGMRSFNPHPTCLAVIKPSPTTQSKLIDHQCAEYGKA